MLYPVRRVHAVSNQVYMSAVCVTCVVSSLSFEAGGGTLTPYNEGGGGRLGSQSIKMVWNWRP